MGLRRTVSILSVSFLLLMVGGCDLIASLITPNRNPTLSLTKPQPNAVITGALVEVEGIAADPDGNLQSVSVWVDERPTLTESTTQFKANGSWTIALGISALPAGTVHIVAQAKDAAGGVSDALKVAVTVSASSGTVMTDAEAVAADKAALQIGFTAGDAATGVTGNLTLPILGVNGSTITWTSTNPAVVTAAGVVTAPTEATPVTLLAAVIKGAASDAKIFALNVLPAAALTDAQAVAADKAALAVGFAAGDAAGAVTRNLTLPVAGSHGTTITWLSSNESVVTPRGVVTRPSTQTMVVLTAMITKESEIETKVFPLTVLQATLTDAQAVAADMGALQIGYAGGDTMAAVTTSVTLPTSGVNGTTILWISDNTAVVSSAGVVTRPAATTNVVLTATVIKGTASASKTFSLTVLQAALSDAQAVAADKSALQVGFAVGDTASAVTANLTLATTGANGSAISWSSSPAGVVGATGTVTRPTAATLVNLTATLTKGNVVDVKVFSLTVLPATLTDAQAVAADKSALEIGFAAGDSASSVTAALTLPVTGANGSTVTWNSNNTTVISAAGAVTRQAVNTPVTMTATIAKGNVSDQKTFPLTVLKAAMSDADAVAADAAALAIGFSGSDSAQGVTGNLTLPTIGDNGTAIAWTSSDPTVVSATGVVTRPTSANATVSLTGTVTKGSTIQAVVFSVTVLKTGLSDAEALAADQAALQITFTAGDAADYVTGNLTLSTTGTNGSSITWSSSNATVVGTTGAVTRQVATTTVTLTATLAKGSATPVTKAFALTVILALPATPSGLAVPVGSATGNSLLVSWTAVPGADSYQVYRGGTLRHNDAGTSFTDDFDQTAGLASGTTYSYSVRAVNTAGSSALSTAVSGTTLKVVPPNLAVGSASATTLTVSWTGIKGATSYQVYRDVYAAGGFTTPAYSGTSTSFTDMGLTGGTTYYYKVKATYPVPAGASDLSSAAYGATTTAGTVATPTFSPGQGSYTTAQTVTISTATSGASIRYTTDGNEPTLSSAQYTAPITVSITTLLKAKAFLAGYTESGVAGATYTMTLPAPTFGYAAGAYLNVLSVNITVAAGAQIRYTTNGTDPSTGGTVIAASSGAVGVSNSLTLKAIALNKSGWSNSTVASADYKIPVAYYPFSASYADASGHYLHGTPYGSQVFGSDRYGTPSSAVSLNGVNQYITLPAEANFDFTTFTLYAVVKFPTPTGKQYTIISKPSDADSYGNYTMNMTSTTSGKAGYAQGNALPVGGNWSHTIYPTALTANVWYHIAMTFSGSSAGNYLNGTLLSTTTGISAPLQSSKAVLLGALNTTNAATFMYGTIDEVVIYKEALTSTEMVGLYMQLD